MGEERTWGKGMGEMQGEETVVRICCMSEESILNRNILNFQASIQSSRFNLDVFTHVNYYVCSVPNAVYHLSLILYYCIYSIAIFSPSLLRILLLLS